MSGEKWVNFLPRNCTKFPDFYQFNVHPIYTCMRRLAKLQEGKKAEMEVLMNSTISKWLEVSTV